MHASWPCCYFGNPCQIPIGSHESGCYVLWLLSVPCGQPQQQWGLQQSWQQRQLLGGDGEQCIEREQPQLEQRQQQSECQQQQQEQRLFRAVPQGLEVN